MYITSFLGKVRYEKQNEKTLFYNLIDGIRSLEFPSLIQKEEYSKTYFSESDYDRLRKDYRKSIEGIRKMK